MPLAENNALLTRPPERFTYHPANVKVERNNSSKLFPDYVLARTKATALGYEISFAESKGGTEALERKTVPPPEWKLQSTNARFIFGTTPQAITQYLLVATRIYPAGKRVKTRRILVRAWNDSVPDAEVTLAAFRDVLVAHYFGVCERCGLTANSQLLALKNYSPVTFDEQIGRRLALVKARLEGTASQELHREQIGSASVYFGLASSTFKVGEMRIRVGLTEPAMRLQRVLQSPEPGVLERLLHDFSSRVAATAKSLSSSEGVFVRADGAIGRLTRSTSE